MCQFSHLGFCSDLELNRKPLHVKDKFDPERIVVCGLSPEGGKGRRRVGGRDSICSIRVSKVLLTLEISGIKM